MSSTPRVRSGAYPQTPATAKAGRSGQLTPSPSPPPKRAASRPSSRHGASSTTSVTSTTTAPAPAAPPPPVIPLTIVDAPTQRFYAAAVYMGLLAWKGYDWVAVVEEGSGSFLQFLKWIVLDFVFLFGLPELRIPWLELSQPVVIAAFLAHVLGDYMLMFNVGVPLGAWVLAIVKIFYDRELSVSERYVQTSTILHNESLISGRQIINILPEGSAVLNPGGLPFCLGGLGGLDNNPAIASLPLYFNSTLPDHVELIRRDFDTDAEETIKLSRSQLREIAKLVRHHEKAAASAADSDEDSLPTDVRYNVPVKKIGAYRLGRVLDEYKLEVQRPMPWTFVVACPAATIRVGPKPPASIGRCRGDLSDVLLEVDGTPPLKIVYSRTINGKDHSFHFQSLQPDGFSAPLGLGALTTNTNGPSGESDLSWASARRVSVGLNETMHVGGDWQYAIDEVHDAFGNVAKYNELHDDDVRPVRTSISGGNTKFAANQHLVQNYVVRERPRVRLMGCDLHRPLKAARGKSTFLPVRYDVPEVPGQKQSQKDDSNSDGTYTITYKFSPLDTLTKSGDHGDVVSLETYKAPYGYEMPEVVAPGLYTLQSVSSNACDGEVEEPSACLLLNPLEPKLTLRSEGIPDSCGGQSIGLRVDLDLMGTPPFVIHYDVSTNGVVRHETVQVPGMRYQMELIPRVAGTHRYLFRTIDDNVYKGQPLTGPDMALEQNVKPPARAVIKYYSDRKRACLEDEVDVDVELSGEAPFVLEWDLLHEGKRRSFTETIDGERFKIKTPPLVEGGEYTLVLTSVRDRSGCRVFLQNDGNRRFLGGNDGELKISVRRQKPRVAFGLIENRRRVLVVEGANVRLPVRLTGEASWIVGYENILPDGVDEAPEHVPFEHVTLGSGNDFLQVNERGTYHIFSVQDNQCPGVVDPAASSFEVDWFPRPTLSVVASDAIRKDGDLLIKEEVCEGDIDGFEIDLKGSPPYHVEYNVRHTSENGKSAKHGKQTTSMIHRQFDAALGRTSIQMDTSKAGVYRYEFAPPADSLYNDNDKTDTSVTLQQTVYAKPTTTFARPGQSFQYCTEQADVGEPIPMVLTGVPPFNVEIEIRHQSGTVADTYRVAIPSHQYGLQIPRQHLHPGTQQIRIRKVRDARGCRMEEGGGSSLPSTSVQVQLFEAPAIYPLETRQDYCVGERLGFVLAGTAPFEVTYDFDGHVRHGSTTTTTFRRVAEAPGLLTVTGVRDRASDCRAAVNLTRTIHPLPSVRLIAQGRRNQVDIHEGGAVDIVFEFGGTPPFEFTYTRSTNAGGRKGSRSGAGESVGGGRSVVLETRHDVSYDMVKTVRASQEGTYEVVAIKDKFCSFSKQSGTENK